MATPVPVTALDLIRLSLKACGVIGVGQNPQAEDGIQGLNVLNMMLAIWQQKRWLVFRLADASLVMTGAQSYTIGAGGDFNIARPAKIDAAFIRLGADTGGGAFNASFNSSFSITGGVGNAANAVDVPLKIIEAREDYNRIATKGIAGFPSCLFYDPSFPVGMLYPWPIPGPSYELHVSIKNPLATFATLASQFFLPGEYEEAIWTNLALRLAPLYQAQIPGSIVQLAAAALNTLRQANAGVPELQYPNALVPRGRGYNILSDGR